MSWKPAVQVYGEEPFYQNGQTFATKEEAEKSAQNRMWNWTLVRDCRADESDEPVNYKWVDGVGDVPLDRQQIVCYNLFMNKDGVTMEELCTCGHSIEEHNNVAGFCRYGWNGDAKKNPCFCQFYSTLINTSGLFVGVVDEDESEDEDDE